VIRTIHKYPEPVLQVAARPVSTIDGKLAGLLDDMVETMYAAPGVGLAAPQIGVSERLIVLDCDSREENEQNKGHGLLKLVNPQILQAEGSIVWEEGCLSVVDFTAEVTRAARVLVSAFTPDEKEVRIEAEGLLAVALQHELDHLDGRLFIDRLSRLKRDLYKRKVKKMIKEGRFEETAAKRPGVHI
jgi:peptide deformylase